MNRIDEFKSPEPPEKNDIANEQQRNNVFPGMRRHHVPAPDPTGFSRFLKILGRPFKRFNRPGEKIQASPTSAIPDEEIEPLLSEEEILFPLETPEEAMGFGGKRKPSLLLRGMGWALLILVVFFLGFSTRPDMMDKTLENLKTWSFLALEKAGPIKDMIYEKTTEIIEQKIPGKKKAVSEDGAQLPSNQKAKPARKIKYWQAPMNPAYTSDKPGKSPMGMDLIPIYEDEADITGGIRINPTVVQNIGVKTERIKKRNLQREIRTIGILTYDERLVHHIHTKYEGWIEKLYVDFTGQEVNENDLLVEIYSPELVSTQEELLLAIKYNQSLKDSPFTDISTGSQRLVESTRRRLELFDVPGHQIDELIRSKKITKTMHVHSPVKGFVIKKHALHGMYIKPGMSLYTIADLSNIWVMADIFEYELPWVKIGQPVEMNLSYFPGKTFKGKITYIDPFLKAQTRTLKVRMEFDNPKWDLKPEMYANIVLKSVIAKQAVAVPEDAVIHSGERSLVVVRTSAGKYESRDLVLGAQAKGYYQVLKGLRAGEEVVTSSSFLIDSESRLKEALGKMEEDHGRVVKDGITKKQKTVKKLPGIVRIEPATRNP